MNTPEGFTEQIEEFLGIRLAHKWEAFATHQPLLVWALNNSTGAILELGIGHYSTPLIHAASERDKRTVLSLETDPDWFELYAGLVTDLHRGELVTCWLDEIEELSKQRWGLIFVDQSDEPMRIEAVRRLHKHCEWMVLHDSDMYPATKCDDYEWWEYFPKTPNPWPERGGPPSLLIRGGT